MRKIKNGYLITLLFLITNYNFYIEEVVLCLNVYFDLKYNTGLGLLY
ncbi:hypothetical protein T190115A13A_140065 [Tenacibaculum sp. 190524A02b]|uniref:Uncharacterized protein n=1 Tax=Tenacibaculum vairaonense TaxID=3137860 RepID=A0ABP1F9T6_9FLAO